MESGLGCKECFIHFRDETEIHKAHLETGTRCDRFLGCILGVPRLAGTEEEWIGVGRGGEDNGIGSPSIAFILKNAFKSLFFIL